MMTKSIRLMTLFVWVGVVSVTTPLIMPPGGPLSTYACDPSNIKKVSIAPNPVNVTKGKTAKVTVTIACNTVPEEWGTGRLNQRGSARFNVRLVDEDSGFRASDDILGSTMVSVQAVIKSFMQPIAVSHVFTLECPSNSIVGDEDSGEAGTPCSDPADLAVEIDQGTRERNKNHYDATEGGTVDACCVEEETSSAPAASGQAFASAGETFISAQPVAMAGVLSGRHRVSNVVTFDPEMHQEFIGELPNMVDVEFDSFGKTGERSIAIRGAAPWVDVTGSVAEDGSVMATGQGTVAGFPNVAVTFQGTFLPGGLAGDYTMGVNGTLPGQPIIYRVEGQDIDWAGFWNRVGTGFQQAAQGIARLNFRADLGGIDFSATTMPMAGDFFQAESGVLFEERQFTVEALSAIADRLTQLANSVSTSSLSNAAALTTRLRESASAFAAAAALKQQINERIQRVGDLDLINLMNEWIGALARAGETLQSVGRLLAQIN